MATVMAGAAISPALALIAKAFPKASPVMIKLILTAPSIMIIPFSFISSYLTLIMTKRTILLLGLTIYLIGGVGAQFVHTIELLLVFRLLLGAGVGFVIPLSMSLINDYFTGKERTKMMGYNSAFSNFGGIVTMMIAGFLATYGWRIPFNVYLLGLVIMFFVFFFLPKNEIQKPDKNTEKSKLPFVVYGYAFAMGGVMLIYYSIATNMALFLEQNKIGGPALAGTIISFTTIGGMTTSLILVWLKDLFKKFIIPVMLLIMGLAFILLTLSNYVPIIIVAVTLIGFGQGVLFPVIILKTLDNVVPYLSDRALALTSSFTFLGQFLSPILLEGMGNLIGNASIRFQYGMIAFFVMLVVIVNIFLIVKNSKAK